MEHAHDRLAPYKRPKEVFRLDEFPHTSTGKLQRSRLPGIVSGNVGGADSA
jgi:acyl-CoA synthetase (AMP-forming)/AMP-acid ligase II